MQKKYAATELKPMNFKITETKALTPQLASMKIKFFNIRFALLISATICLLNISREAAADLTYDLRFITNAQHSSAKSWQLSPSDVGTPITLQLWGVLAKGPDGTFAGNDTLVSGYVNLYSHNTVSNGAITAGSGISNAAFPNTAKLNSNASNLGTGGNLLIDHDSNSGTAAVADGILDWGADQVYTTSGIATGAQNLYAAEGANSTTVNHAYYFSFGALDPIVAGTPITGSQLSPTDANKWEVLLGTFTLNVNGLTAGGTTTFDPYINNTVRLPSPGVVTAFGMNYSQDGVNQNALGINGTQFSGVSLIVVPEPSHIAMVGFAIASLYLYRNYLKRCRKSLIAIKVKKRSN